MADVRLTRSAVVTFVGDQIPLTQLLSALDPEITGIGQGTVAIEVDTDPLDPNGVVTIITVVDQDWVSG